MNPMQIIVGLGNPGVEYEHTRHNVGFDVLDILAKNMGVPFTLQPKLKAMIAKKGDILLVKPQTYMNLSGMSVRATVQFYAKDMLAEERKESLYVIHDDLDIPFGKAKFVFGSGPKAHNGINSIREQLGGEQFWYVRVGIDARDKFDRVSPADYVLMRFTPDEEVLMHRLMEEQAHNLYVKINA